MIRSLCISLMLISPIVIAKVAVTEDSFLWTIEKNGFPTSYLLGTIHLGKKGDVLSKPLRHILQKSAVLVQEVLIDTEETASEPSPATINLARRMYNTQPDLPKLLGPKYMAKLNRCQLLAEQNQPVNYLKPWVAVVFCLHAYPENMTAKTGIDLLLKKEALRMKKHTLGLESEVEAMQYFEDIPQNDALDWLKNILEHHDEMKQTTERWVDEYQKNQFQKMMTEVFEHQIGIEYFPKKQRQFWRNFFFKQLLVERNKKWMPKLQQILQENAAFISVGAAHLAAEEGLIVLLRQQGFKLTPVFNLHE